MSEIEELEKRIAELKKQSNVYPMIRIEGKIHKVIKKRYLIKSRMVGQGEGLHGSKNKGTIRPAEYIPAIPIIEVEEK